MRVDKRELFLNAWEIYRGQKVKSFSDALKRAWVIAKAKAARPAVVVKEEPVEFKQVATVQTSFFFAVSDQTSASLSNRKRGV